MGRGFAKRKNALKKQYLSQAVKYIEQLEKENQSLKSDPNTIIGQFIGGYRELYSQNSRLSVLSAALLKRLGDKVELTKEEMEAFQGNRINIKWELPEGVEKHEDAKSYFFTYELAPADPVDQQLADAPPTETPGQEVALTEEQPVDDLTEENLSAIDSVSQITTDAVVDAVGLDGAAEVVQALESE